MDLIRFLADFFAIDGSGNPVTKYLKGALYPVTEETTSQVAAGTAEIVSVTDEPKVPLKTAATPQASD